MRPNVKCRTSDAERKGRPAFTLIEILTVTAIIGLISTMGTVGYGYVRMKARDTKRLADIRTIRNAIELYFEFNDRYPSVNGDGVVLGSPEATSISAAGITSAAGRREPIFLDNVPSNIEPGGLPYHYSTRSSDGGPCYGDACGGFQIIFSLESAVGDYAAGTHRLTETQVEGPEGGRTTFSLPQGLSAYVPSRQDVVVALGTVADINDAARKEVSRPEVQTASAFVAPVSVAAAGANVAAAMAGAVPIANAGQFLALLISQPLLFLSRKKRASWGVVFDAATRVPVDLASVRLIDPRTGRAVATKVTDKDGRYAFTAKAGSYRMEVAKPGYRFPAISLQGAREDGKFLDLYHGTLLAVAADGTTIAQNIPVDPIAATTDDVGELMRRGKKGGARRAVAMIGPVLGGVTLFITPSIPMLLIFLAHLFVYVGFKRLAEAPAPKSQGVVYDADTRDPVAQAIVRILSLPYHKVLETRVTDARGHYSFYVGNGLYEVTVTKPGYQKTETDAIDYTAIDAPTFIAADLPLKKAS